MQGWEQSLVAPVPPLLPSKVNIPRASCPFNASPLISLLTAAVEDCDSSELLLVLFSSFLFLRINNRTRKGKEHSSYGLLLQVRGSEVTDDGPLCVAR